MNLYGRLKKIIVPKLRYSQDVYIDVLETQLAARMRWLDVGCGHHIFPPWRLEDEKQFVSNKSVVGIDLDLNALRRHRTLDFRVFGSASSLPFENESFDIVTANMVVEHLTDPAIQFREVFRVLRPGGKFVFHTVNARSYFVRLRRLVPEQLVHTLARILDGREAIDVFPVMYKANTELSIRRLSEPIGFADIQFKFLVTDCVFARVPPVAFFELIFIRLLMKPQFRVFRTNIIGILTKPG